MTDLAGAAEDAAGGVITLDLAGEAALDAKHRAWLEEIAVSARAPFNALVQRLAAPHGDDIDWWVTPIATRNVFASALFLRCCRLLLAIRAVESCSVIKHIVVESPGVATALRTALARRNRHVSVSSRQGVARFRAKTAAGMLMRTAAALFHTLNQIVFSRVSGAPSRPLPSEPLVLLDTFVYRDSFDGPYRDRHYPGLIECLTESERRYIFFLPTYYKVRNYLGFFRAMRSSAVNFVVKEDYLRVSDYSHALTHPLRSLRFTVAACRFGEEDVAAMVNEAVYESFANSGSIEGLLRHHLAARLREAGMAVRLAIDWFENQEIDHGANAGLRSAMPQTRVVGYQGFIVSDHYLCTFPTEQEQRLGLIPHRITVTGSALVQRLKAFCPNLDVVVAPAFRFAALWRERPLRTPSQGLRVLVALPLMAREAADVLALITDAVAAPPRAASPGWRIRVKAHPSFSGRLPRGLDQVQGDLDDLIADSDVLVSAASSACVQALAHGVPVVVLGSPNSITMNPIPHDFDRDMWCVCHTAIEVNDALVRYAQRDGATITRHHASGAALREQFFEPVTRAGVLDFLAMHEPPGHTKDAASVAPC